VTLHEPISVLYHLLWLSLIASSLVHFYTPVGPWANNCIGLNNYRNFYCFLLWVTIGTGYVLFLLYPVVLGGSDPILHFSFTGWVPNLLIVRSRVKPRAAYQKLNINMRGDKDRDGGLLSPAISASLRGSQQQQSEVSRRLQSLSVYDPPQPLLTSNRQWTTPDYETGATVSEGLSISSLLHHTSRRLLETADTSTSTADSGDVKRTRSRNLLTSTYRSLSLLLEDLRTDAGVLMLIMILSLSLCIAVGILLSLHTYLGENT
jgi:DHHC palmitoyltransferase